jgi:hypothetical protein
MRLDNPNTFKDHKIIASESRSWYVGKPGTSNESFSITWSPGALVVYGQIGCLTLIYSGFNSYAATRKWMNDCDIDRFKGTIAHEHPDNIDYYYQACRFWGSAPHYQ